MPTFNIPIFVLRALNSNLTRMLRLRMEHGNSLRKSMTEIGDRFLESTKIASAPPQMHV